MTVEAGGLVDLYSATVMSKGVLTIASGAIVSGVTVSSGGRLSGPGALGGGFYDASSDYGVVSAVRIGDDVATDFGGDAQLDVETSGVAVTVTVVSGLLSVMSGGSAYAPVVTAGGELVVSSGGIATKAAISAGGLEVVFAAPA